MTASIPNRRRRVGSLVAVAALALGATSCGDDDDAGDSPGAQATATAPGATAASETKGTGGGEIDPLAATVEVTGAALPLLAEGDDPAVGERPPTLAGTTYSGEPIEIVPGADGATMLVFLAHWCPHCNAEIPVLLEWRDAGMIPEGLDVVGVSTGVRADAPNFPPDEWLAEAGWDWPALADSPASGESPGAGADAYGLSAFPFFTIIGADGTVKLRAAGEKSLEELDALVTEALGA